LSPAVGILVGSDADLAAVEGCTARLEDYGVQYEVEVRDVHTNPESVSEYAGTARERGLKVLICAAGMSAHLAGAVATRTNLPVIGIPMATGTLGGFDALLATAQMPPGAPVATVAVNGDANAAVLATQILALSDPDLADRLEGGS
jgi:5-(carboxyamino)imidazole ribonucleotide mutase